MARKGIDKNIRDNVWRRYWGSSTEGQCWVCGRHIEIGNFDCGPASIYWGLKFVLLKKDLKFDPELETARQFVTQLTP